MNDIYMDLNRHLCELFRDIAAGDYGNSRIEALFELTREEKYPGYITDLAENFGMMLVQVEARELRSQHLIRELEQARLELREYAQTLEQKVAEKTTDLRLANEELMRLSLVDGLTGIANRRHFNQYLESTWQLLSREQKPLSLILIDVDFFKKYNDHFGHSLGDECLARVAQALSSCARRSPDLVTRYGGEEFAVILPDTDPCGAVYCAETMRSAVKSLAMQHPHSLPDQRVTISLGVATACPEAEATPISLIKAADACLYQAKAAGRNRVVSAPHPGDPGRQGNAP